jgi:leucyl-tRNA---protein transferase
MVNALFISAACLHSPCRDRAFSLSPVLRDDAVALPLSARPDRAEGVYRIVGAACGRTERCTWPHRPSCLNCQSCIAVRVLADEFEPNASQRKLLKRHADIEVSACRAWSTDEQFDLLGRYLSSRHPGGGMAGMDELDYADMVEQSPVDSYVVEYREPAAGGRPGRLIGACLTDRQHDGLSMIYSFFEADNAERPGLGNFIIMDHIMRAADAGLPHVYLGYWVAGSKRMEYKVRYRPMEKLGPSGWSRLRDEEVADSLRAAGLPGAPEGRKF